MGPKLHEILRTIMFNALRVIDIGLIMLAFGCAAVAGLSPLHWNTVSIFFASKVTLASCIWLVTAILLCYGIFSTCGLYQSKRMSTKRAEVADVLRAITVSTVLLWLEGRLLSLSMVSPRFLITFWFCAATLVIPTRFILRWVLAAIRRRGHNLHHILVLGTNTRAMEFGRSIQARSDRGYRLLGFVDDDWHGLPRFRQMGFDLVCSHEQLPEFLRRNVVDEIALYLPLRSFYERAAQIANLAKQHGILLRFDNDIFDLFRTEQIDAPTQLRTNSSGIDGEPLLLKRILDLVGSVVLLITLSPLFLIVAIVIKLTSPGPVFFPQRRVGLNKREFIMFKFRTMVPDAESIQEQLAHLNEMSGPVFKIRNDPRITPVGRVLRRTSIDELPQLFNVLKGDMSLVGPRAMSVRDYRLFSEDWQRRRFSVPPGITCLWQVQGRNTIPFEQWMLLDMQYIDKWSLWLDLQILARTIPAVFKGSGAG